MTILKKPVRRVTTSALDGTFGPDRRKRIVITLIPGNGADVPDTLELRPERTKRPERIAVLDVYRFAMRCRVNCQLLTKARERKAKKEAARERARIARADRKLSQPFNP